MTATQLEFAQYPSASPKSQADREAILADPGFGNHFTDHTVVVDFSVDASGEGGWGNARLEAYGPIAMDPAAAVLHYGQEIFEGMKAYRHADGSIWTFRPEANAARLNRSAARIALPQLPEDVFLESLRQLVAADRDWVPTRDGESLYLRPFMIATLEAEAHGCKQVLFLDQLNNNAVEELGGMNVFFVFKDGTLVTPALSGTILEGVTRASIIQLAKDRGLNVQERVITLDEWRAGVGNGDITEVFACGTAAVITPIGELKDGDEVISAPDPSAGEVTMALREQLLGIQTGRVEDLHGWMTRLV